MTLGLRCFFLHMSVRLPVFLSAWLCHAQAEFQVPMFTSSGVQVRFLKVYDKSGYLTKRWVRYITRAGHYQIRI